GAGRPPGRRRRPVPGGHRRARPPAVAPGLRPPDGAGGPRTRRGGGGPRPRPRSRFLDPDQPQGRPRPEAPPDQLRLVRRGPRGPGAAALIAPATKGPKLFKLLGFSSAVTKTPDLAPLTGTGPRAICTL